MENNFTRSQRTKKITVIAVMAALVFVVTYVTGALIPIRIGHGGYINLGDVVIYISAFILGGPSAAIAAALGSGLADVVMGAGVYIPATIIVKGLMGLVVGLITKKQDFPTYFIGCFVGGAIMLGGYTLFEYFFLGGLPYITASVVPNLIQWVGATIIAVAFFAIVKRISMQLKFRELMIEKK